MKKLIVNRREYDISCTDVTCEPGKITVDRWEISVPKDEKIYLETKPNQVRIEFPT